MRLLFFSCFLLSISLHVLAQTDPITQIHGARSQGMGNLRVHGYDAWTYFNNPGGLANLKSSVIAIGVDQRYGLKELSTLDITGAWKNQYGTWAAGISRFGGKLFNQHLLGIAFSNQLGIVSIGAKAEWFQTQIEGFGTGNTFIFSLGGIAELSPQFNIGASISNLNRAKISSDSEQRLPTGISLALNYKPVESLTTQLEIEKDILLKPVVKVGLEYGLKDWLYLRSGINSNPSKLFFGLGLRYQRVGFDYAYGQNHALGTTHHVSFNLSLGEQ